LPKMGQAGAWELPDDVSRVVEKATGGRDESRKGGKFCAD
jgi:hypothetical protein